MNGNDATAYNQNLVQHTPDNVIAVAVLGAESTGKTTLCRDLAAHFDCPWVPEYMRTYLQTKWDNKQQTCTWEDLLPIARGQVALENKLAAKSAKALEDQQLISNNSRKNYLFCDTSLFELMVYCNWYYGSAPAEITQAALAHHYDLILLTKVDTPWVADDLRDSPYHREEMTTYFENHLQTHNKRFRYIGGSEAQRVQQVINWLDEN